MNTGYMIYTAERVPSRAEQGAIDAQRGELALTLASLLRRRRTATEAKPGSRPLPGRPARA